jgi:hypothetical protein
LEAFAEVDFPGGERVLGAADAGGLGPERQAVVRCGVLGFGEGLLISTVNVSYAPSAATYASWRCCRSQCTLPVDGLRPLRAPDAVNLDDDDGGEE